jgi:putative acetyltransferase
VPVEIAPYRREHGDAFRSLVVSTLAEFGFREDPQIDGDLAAPDEHYDAVWVVLDEGAVVGSVAVRRDGADAAELKRMYLRPDVRGHGLGRALLERAVAWAREQNLAAVRLDTSEDMVTARRLYESAGFRRTGTRTESGPVDCRCELLYELDLRASDA